MRGAKRAGIHLTFLMGVSAMVVGGAPSRGEGIGEAGMSVATANDHFAFDLYGSLVANRDDDLLLSPYSLTTALGLVAAGARGETLEELVAGLHMPDQETALLGFRALTTAIPADKEADGYELRSANRLWGQEGFPFEQAYLALARESFAADLEAVDFSGRTEAARLRINDWVEDATRGKIQDMLPEGSLSPDSRLVITNATYFLAEWLHKFPGHATEEGTFHLRDGSKTKASMMRQTGRYEYTHSDELGAQVIVLPYGSNAPEKSASMVLLIPDRDKDLETLEAALSPSAVKRALEETTLTHVGLALPKFRIESTLSLGEALEALGMESLFAPEAADLSGIALPTGGQNLYVSKVLQKTYIQVDESGTEAAGATAVVIGVTSAPPGPEVMVEADRPFVFMIQDDATGAILFLGRLVDPR